jgi:uncharacterized protein (TIGR01777 family)
VLTNTTAIIHLAGASIADKPWTEKRKKQILETRTHSTALLNRALQHSLNKVTTFVSASGANYYGYDKDERLFTEDDYHGDDYLADVVVQWENVVDKIQELNIRTVKMRTGFVLSKDGGALKELARPVKLGVGASLGTGKQRVSWIHIDDVCAMFIKALTDQSMEGVYNAGGPSLVTNEELTKTIAKVLGKPLWLPNIPSFVFKLLLGEMADLVLQGTSISSQKIQKAGFTYKFGTLEWALKDIYNKR